MVGQMSRGGIVACDECTKSCLKIHHLKQRGPSSTGRRFFKIMLGENYSQVLYLPPKFARDVRHLVGQETQIEDSNGEKWTVQFSYVDGALAFHEGWYKFVEDHQLEHGEFLVFNYIKHGHFVVQIYGPSACEIMDFNRERKLSKKRSRSDQETVYQDEPHQIRNERCTPSKNMEDPSCMLNRDSGKYEVEDREFLFDLSNLEMGKNSSVAEKSATSLDRNDTPVGTQIRDQIEVIRNYTQMSTPLTDQKNNHLCSISVDAFQTKPSGISNSSKDMPDDVSKFQAGETENNCLHGIPSDALQNKPSGNSDSNKGKRDGVVKFLAGEMENNRLCGIFSHSHQKKPSGNSDSMKSMIDASKFQSGGTNNYQSCGIFNNAFLDKPSSNSDASKDTFDYISKLMACDSGEDMFDDVSKYLACVTSASTPFVARDMKSPYTCSSLLTESDYSINSKHCDVSVTSSMLKDPFGKSAATFKKEVVKLGEEVYGFTRVSSEDAGLMSTLRMKYGQISPSCIKTEPDTDDVLATAVATSPFSAEVKSLKFVELPLGMPSIQGKRERGRVKVVYLKDSTTRLWPVQYPHKSFVGAFTVGWKTFCKGNSIRAGDVCTFQVETYTPCVFKVDIIRKASKSSER